MNKLYNDLMTLVENSECFIYRDYELGGVTQRVFDYTFLASYTEWLQPGALECRGITFSVDGDNVRCVSRPFEKFFGLFESKFTMDLDLSTTVSIQDKMDGSMIATVQLPNGRIIENEGKVDQSDGIWLKSKGSLFSEQAYAANELYNTPEYAGLRRFCEFWVGYDHTVIMEYVAPTNRIVLGYMEPALKVLAVRSLHTGEYHPFKQLRLSAPYADEFFVDELDVGDDIVSFVDSIKDMEGVEGYVLTLQSGQRVKIKTAWYCSLHKLKDGINFPRRLFEACVLGASDDLKAQFHDDPLAMSRIIEMEEKVRKIYKDLTTTVETFYTDNKDLERKAFAILGQLELNKLQFGMVMNLYLGKEVDYQALLIKHWKDYGITEESVDTTDQ